MRLALAVLAVLVGLAGCGGEGSGSETTDTTGGEAATTVYFLRDGKVWPVVREIDGADAAMALSDGPTDEEASELDLTTAVPEVTVQRTVEGDFAVESDEELSDDALAQLAHTLLVGEAAANSIETEGGQLYKRGDFEEQTPSVLVESPLAFAEISSPLRARGTANTFEATFSFEILDADGEVIAADFVTATSGSGTRGTWSFEQPFVVEDEQDGTLRVFELSAEDGSRMNEVDIPVRLLP